MPYLSCLQILRIHDILAITCCTLNINFILLPVMKADRCYLSCECGVVHLLAPLFNNQHVHPHPVITAARIIISRPITIPRTFFVASQLFVLASLLSCCVIGGLVLSGAVVILLSMASNETMKVIYIDWHSPCMPIILSSYLS